MLNVDRKSGVKLVTDAVKGLGRAASEVDAPIYAPFSESGPHRPFPAQDAADAIGQHIAEQRDRARLALTDDGLTAARRDYEAPLKDAPAVRSEYFTLADQVGEHEDVFGPQDI